METPRSTDGTPIAYERAGEGPALVLAVGAIADADQVVVDRQNHEAPDGVFTPLITEYFRGSLRAGVGQGTVSGFRVRTWLYARSTNSAQRWASEGSNGTSSQSRETWAGLGR
ncbi:MAG: hypothetical protein JWQ43_1933 [Glaciihabitans sp.]|nr:hypothetical protein [Glaciihabitans sp.]